MYILLFALLLVVPAHAHIGDRIYPIPEIIDEDLDQFDLFDTSLDEWRSILQEPTLQATDFIADPTVGEGAPYDPADLDYQFWLGWNGLTDRLYVAMERFDDVFVNEYAGGNLGDLWRHDGNFQFLVDGDHSGGDITGSADPDWTDEEKTLNNNRTAQMYEATAHAPDGKHVGYLGAGSAWVNVLPYTDAGGGTFSETPTVSIFEGYVTPFDDLIWNSPEDSKKSDLAPDRIIGLSISIPDFDTEPSAYRAFHYLPGTTDTWRYASKIYDCRLLSAQRETSVEDISWARIKASFADR
jgi:hypothetical protein